PADSSRCQVGFLGDDGGAPDFDIQVLLADDTVAVLVDGGVVPMIPPPQGGRVIFVGVRATNVDGCGLQLTGALRDPATGRVSVDSRTVNLTSTGDGWGASGTSTSISGAISSFSNVRACPNDWSRTDLDGHAFGLEVTIVDREARTLTKKIQVTPRCGAPDNVAECVCLCRAGYVLGQACGDGAMIDAGAGE
ncbi:MAG: hypothetical protein M3O46_21485, partial [Myxococcota bacterium]|nr:hypothetical protein [Myxococcota bacterium]